MKNKVLLFALLLSFATSCIFDDTNSPVEEAGDTYLSLKSSQIMLPSDQTGVNMESITIESLRIMVFSKATGQVVTNKVFDIANLNLATKDPVSGYWIIDFSNIVVATKPGPSIVYVVLNENIMSISGQTLTGALNAIPNITGMKTLVDTPLSYIHPLRVVYDTNEKPIEPPFIMSTFDEFDIPPNMPKSNPYVADLRGPSETKKGFELDRTMAKVTLDSISSYPRYTGETTDNKQTSYIFILKVGLVNVPTQYLWSPNRLQTTPPANPAYTVPVPPYTGSFQTLDFGLEDPILGYYDRDWNGNIVLNIDANAYEVQELKDSRIWYTGDGNGINSFNVDSAALDRYIAKNGIKSNDKFNYQYYLDKFNGNVQLLELNQGNFIDFINYIIALYQGASEEDYLPTWYELKEPYTITPTITGAYWSLKEKNISYYVPEHILANKADKANATKLHIKAAEASVPSKITKEMSYNIQWNNPVWESWIYAISVGSKNFLDMSKQEQSDVINQMWGYQLDSLTYPGKTIVRHYWRGGIRYHSGDVTGTLDGVQFQNITNSTDIKDFYLPIQNTPTTENPVDYNIYRNHEYKFSVHALEQWTPGASGQATTARSTGEDQPGRSMVLRFNDH